MIERNEIMLKNFDVVDNGNFLLHFATWQCYQMNYACCIGSYKWQNDQYQYMHKNNVPIKMFTK